MHKTGQHVPIVKSLVLNTRKFVHLAKEWEVEMSKETISQRLKERQRLKEKILVGMAIIQAGSPVFRAVNTASIVLFSPMLALAAVGGVLRSTVNRMLYIGNWPASSPISSVSITTRLTVCQFVALGIKNATTCAEPAEAFGSLRFPKRGRVKCVGNFFFKPLSYLLKGFFI